MSSRFGRVARFVAPSSERSEEEWCLVSIAFAMRSHTIRICVRIAIAWRFILVPACVGRRFCLALLVLIACYFVLNPLLCVAVFSLVEKLVQNVVDSLAFRQRASACQPINFFPVK